MDISLSIITIITPLRNTNQHKYMHQLTTPPNCITHARFKPSSGTETIVNSKPSPSARTACAHRSY